MLSFIMGVCIGTVGGMLLMVIFVAGKKEESQRDTIYNNVS